MSKQYIAVLGHTGRDPEAGETKVGPVVKFPVAQKIGYGEGDTRWYDVTVFNEGLRQRISHELPKGSLVVVEGFASEREYNGKIYHQIVADRVGLVQAFQASKRNAAPAPVVEGFSSDL